MRGILGIEGEGVCHILEIGVKDVRENLGLQLRNTLGIEVEDVAGILGTEGVIQGV